MVNMVNIIPAEHQHVSIVTANMLAFSSKHITVIELLASLWTLSFLHKIKKKWWQEKRDKISYLDPCYVLMGQ